MKRLFEKLASEACHSAIRAGDHVDAFQAREIVAQLFSCRHAWNCPHGRPTVVRIPRGKLEEWFQRRPFNWPALPSSRVPTATGKTEVALEFARR